ncbi:type II secretion system protein GspL [Verticiella sediminum]|uniref:type II secretion system protein GspL n=1 Tax=Verticiella sediminum TaxID=1247510 RepID=UPI0014782686|nr:type II secretion system protein GspL [Verticiella sediminum]
MKATLRLQLPRLAELAPQVPLRFALVQQGQAVRSGELTMAQLAATLPPVPAAAILHPADANLAAVVLPPLPAHRMASAVAGAAEPLLLGDSEPYALAHGARAANGATPIAWADRSALARAWALLADAGLPVQALVPAPLALPLPEDGELVLAVQDHVLLARAGRDAGSALVLPDDARAAAANAMAWLRLTWQRQPQAQPVWLGAVPSWYAQPGPDAPAPRVLPADAGWGASLPAWSLALPALRPRRMQASTWRRPLAWAAAAAALWLLGLNLHAARLSREADAVRAQMAAAVRAAFPDIPVVLDPLRQATQRRDALLAAVGDRVADDVVTLALAGARLLPAGAQVDRLHYEDGVLAVSTVGDVGARALDPDTAARARDLDLEIEQRDGTWLLRPRVLGAGIGADTGVLAPRAGLGPNGGAR